MAFVVIYDACVLFPPALGDLFIRLAQTGLFQAKWTDEILDEAIGAILKRRPNVDPEAIQRTRQLMNRAIRDVLVTGYEDLTDTLCLPDPDDRHVLAAAIRANAQVIVTFNIRDFPASALVPYDIEAQTPDVFVRYVLSLPHGRAVFARVIREQAADLKNPPRTPEDILNNLAANGLRGTVARFRREPHGDETDEQRSSTRSCSPRARDLVAQLRPAAAALGNRAPRSRVLPGLLSGPQ